VIHEWPAWAGMAAAILAAYTVFGLTGFGSAVVGVPILAQFVPLTFAVPLVMLLDLVSTLAVGALNWRLVSRGELLRLVPFMAVGIYIGVTLLVNVEPRWLLMALGIFVLANALWNLARRAPAEPVSGWWSAPAGVAGGVFSALFGTGGPIYTTYLARRVDASAFRATTVTIILMSGLIRLATFAGNGLLFQAGLIAAWLWFLPVCALGVFLGSRLHARLPPAKVKQALFLLLAVSGVAVLARSLTG